MTGLLDWVPNAHALIAFQAFGLVTGASAGDDDDDDDDGGRYWAWR